MALFIAGHNPPQKARKYRDANQRILVLTQTYQPLNAGNPHFFEQNQIFHDQPIIDFLDRISHNYEWTRDFFRFSLIYFLTGLFFVLSILCFIYYFVL